MSRIRETTMGPFLAALTACNATPPWLPPCRCKTLARAVLLHVSGCAVLLMLAAPLDAQQREAQHGAGALDTSAASLEALIERTEKKVAVLAGKLRACQATGQDIAIPDADLAVAELFIRFSRHDAQAEDLREQAFGSMQYVDAMLDRALAKIDDVLTGKTDYPKIPDWNVIGLEVRSGGFWSGDQRVFLSGLIWTAGLAQTDSTMLKRLGVNLVDWSVTGSMRESGEFSAARYATRDRVYLDAMARKNFAVDGLLSLGPPGWLYQRFPDLSSPGHGHYENYAIDHPALIEYQRKCLDHYIPLLARHRALLAIDLANEPAFHGASAYTFANWHEWLRNKYGSLEEVNRAWGMDFRSFDAIRRFPTQPKKRTSPWQRARVDWNQPGMRGMHYDWNAFNKKRVTDYFGRMNEKLRTHAPRVATHVKIMMSNYFTGSSEKRGWPMALSYNTFGIDAEALTEMCTLSGCDLGIPDLSTTASPSRYYGSVPYAIGWLNTGLATDFLQSICPDKPFYNSELHAVEEGDAEQIHASPAEHMQLALWLSHLHGMSANMLWYWGRNQDGSIKGQGKQWFRGSLLQQPWLLRAYVHQSLNLRRFVPQVSAFARQPRMVRLLYSEPSAIQDVHHIDALRDAYEALNFLAVSIGLVTERQLARNALPAESRLVIVPNARYVADATVEKLRSLAAKGVRVGILGKESLAMDPVGQRRKAADVPGAASIPLGTPPDYWPRLDHWITSAEIPRELQALDTKGNPVWGIEVRTARAGDQRVAYLANVMRTPVTVHLQWASEGARFRDLRTETPVPPSLTLRPREVVFGGY